jgi:broad specificity phosphatase PhoE
VEIYLLRHGQTLQTGTYTGSTNVELSAEGRRQIAVLSPFLQSLKFDNCFCSPLIRCVQTLTLLNVDSAAIFDECLQEIDFGGWEGLSFEQVQKKFSDQLADWVREGEDFSFPGGEMIRTFNSRITRWLDNLLTNEFNRVLIVTHGGVIRIAICHLLGIETARAFTFNPMEGKVSMVHVVDGFGQLEMLNCKVC